MQMKQPVELKTHAFLELEQGINELRTNVLTMQTVHFGRCPSGAALRRITAPPLF
jgi:hypothetical protein